MTEGRGRYSPSRLQTYSTCAHAYYLEKVVKAPQRQAVWFVQGTAVHAAIEAYERSFRTLEADEAIHVFEASWTHELTEAQAEEPDERMWMVGGRRKLVTDIEKRHELGSQQVIDYIDANPPGDELGPAELIPGEAAVETGFELDFGEFLVRGYIDFIREERGTGRLFPEDWKTGSKVPADPYQLATYKVAIEQLTGVEVEWGRFWMCKDNGPVTVDLRPYTLDVVRDWYQQFHEGKNHGVFLANPGDACFTCTVKPSCPFAA